MSHATFAAPDLTAFCRLDGLGLEVTGQQVTAGRAVLACRVVEPDSWCSRCGCEGSLRDTVTRRLAHEPLGWRPTELLVTVRRYRCCGCGHVWRQDMTRAAEPRARISRGTTLTRRADDALEGSASAGQRLSMTIPVTDDNRSQIMETLSGSPAQDFADRCQGSRLCTGQ